MNLTLYAFTVYFEFWACGTTSSFSSSWETLPMPVLVPFISTPDAINCALIFNHPASIWVRYDGHDANLLIRGSIVSVSAVIHSCIPEWRAKLIIHFSLGFLISSTIYDDYINQRWIDLRRFNDFIPQRYFGTSVFSGLLCYMLLKE